MTLRKGEDTVIWKRKLWIALCGELALEEALDLSWDRLLNEWIPRRLNFICRRFGTLCLFHLHRRIGMKDEWGRECWGIHTGKRFGSKIAWANRKEGDKVGVGPSFLLAQAVFEPNLFTRMNTPTFSTPFILHTYPPMKMEQSVPKRRHIKFRRRGITQKKAYNIQNTAKVWNDEYWCDL